MFVQDVKGKDVDLSVYRGKVVMVVNVASQWYSSYSALLAFISSVKRK